MTKKYCIKTLGCKVNQYESEAAARCLRDAGFAEADDEGAADVCIINTCAVTHKAAMQSRQAVRQSVRAHPGAVIIVTGCYAQTHVEDIRRISGVHAIVGHGEKTAIPDMAEGLLSGRLSPPISAVGDVRSESTFREFPAIVHGDRTRPFLKIQDGCESFCTFCIVPYARGPSRSLPPDRAMAHIRALKAHGYREVVLTGIHLGRYGHDLSPASDLLDLLKTVCAKPDIDRVRLSSLEPNEIHDNLIRFMADNDAVCKHVHIPLQSGDDGVLKRMHRPYIAGYFRDQVLRIRAAMPDAAIGIDALAGFPGEDDRAFENTYELIRNLPATYLHVFPYSPRKKTPASAFSDRAHPDVIKKRCKVLRRLGNEKRGEFYRRFIGKPLELLIEGPSDASPDMVRGMTSNYIPVRVPKETCRKHDIVRTIIERVDGDNRVYGKIQA